MPFKFMTRLDWRLPFLILSLAGTLSLSARLQFDVFLGYDDTIRDAAWFPIACEVFNDGPAFNATIEFFNEGFSRGQHRRMQVELPTNTRKRFILPAFASGGRNSTWTARLRDEKGNIRDERINLRPREKGVDAFLLGAVPRTFAGLPVLPDAKSMLDEQTPKVARMQTPYFPDNPLTLEGLDVLYLNSEKALELTVPQRTALLAWLYQGGHLILAVEQPTDLSGTPWLQNLSPVTFESVRTVVPREHFLQWLRNTPFLLENPVPDDSRRNSRDQIGNPFENLLVDPPFDLSALPVNVGKVRDGEAWLTIDNVPLVVRARRGRGQLTLLTFSPEREPFRSWKHRAWFWTKISNAPVQAFLTSEGPRYGSWSLDGVFGAMLDSRQVRKLPITWLLLLLGVYLAVIGPLDQYWLKRLNKQMWTWITFPAYVALFSALIYFIGYKLRAGDTEWNELQLVDVLPRANQAELRGRTYASLYSPANTSYQLASEQPHATLRGEFHGIRGGGQESGRAKVEQLGRGFKAEIFVPVWSSQLYVSDWWQPAEMPLIGKLNVQNGRVDIEVQNRLNQKLAALQLAFGDRVFDFGELEPMQSRKVSWDLLRDGIAVSQLMNQSRSQFYDTVQQRGQALGSDRAGRLDSKLSHLVAASLVSRLSEWRQRNRFFVASQGWDLTRHLERGDALLFAWAPGVSVAPAIQKFGTARSQRSSLLRLVIPAQQPLEAP